MQLLVLHGAPGAGKLTVAKELRALTGYRLFHNHLTFDLVASVFDLQTLPARELRERVWLDTLGTAARADIALVGIGGTDDGCTMVRSGCLSLDEIARLREAGAVGDVLGNYVDVRGTLIVAPHSQRLIALSIDELLRIGTVVAVASEREEPLAILGALRAGVIDVLIVDEGNARAVLEVGLAAPRDDAAPRSIQLEPAR